MQAACTALSFLALNWALDGVVASAARLLPRMISVTHNNSHTYHHSQSFTGNFFEGMPSAQGVLGVLGGTQWWHADGDAWLEPWQRFVAAYGPTATNAADTIARWALSFGVAILRGASTVAPAWSAAWLGTPSAAAVSLEANPVASAWCRCHFLSG